MISFTVPCVPVAQPRQRVAIRGGRAATYTPTKHPVTAFKATVRMAASQAYVGPPLEGPLSVVIEFVLPRPKSATKKRSDNPRLACAKKPDFDNLAKSVSDALNGLCWVDDAQLQDVRILKWVASATEQPHVNVSIVQVQHHSTV